MGYTTANKYLKLFDRNTAPIHLEWLAGRYGAQRHSSESAAGEKIYLDVGCAAGKNILILAPLFPEVKFIGVDLNPEHIFEAQQEQTRLGLTNATFICADFATATELPPADYINVHGVYSWLSAEVKQQFDLRLMQLAKPGALLKLLYGVKPGAALREDLGHLFNTMQQEHTPANGRRLLELVNKEAAGLKRMFAPAWFDSQMKHMHSRSDELWWHDYLSRDFCTEYADSVITRLERAGFTCIAAAAMDQNIPAILASRPLCDFAAGLPMASRATFMDQVTGRAFRDDVFVKDASPGTAPALNMELRLGCLWSKEQMLSTYNTPQGQVNFRQPISLQIVEALYDMPLNVPELQAKLHSVPLEDLLQWVDLLMAATRIAPFLPSAQASATNRQRVRELNCERLAASMQNFNLETTTSLLAIELGNSIDVGWFETLVLAHFHQRHEPATKRQMQERLSAAGISLAGPDGNIGRDQSAALELELAKLEQGYLGRLSYWGLAV